MEEGTETVSVLVLNSAFQPLSVIPERRLVVLHLNRKIVFLDEDVRRTVEASIRTRSLQYDRPVIVQLISNIHVPRMALRPTRANIMLRDEDTCQYCGKKSRDLTLDHVMPRSRGGGNTWENLVACCKLCNSRKGSRLLKEVNMRLLHQPKPLAQEYGGVFLLRYPQLREAYEKLLHSYYID